MLPLGSMQEMSIAVEGSEEELLLIGKVVRIEEESTNRFNIGLSFSFKEMAKEASNQIASFLKDYTLLPHHSSPSQSVSH